MPGLIPERSKRTETNTQNIHTGLVGTRRRASFLSEEDHTMKINRAACSLPLLPAFADLLDGLLAAKEGPVVVSFRDKDYSPETGGYHPVEVRVRADGTISYITDFSYCGGPFPELVKELDFDFSVGAFGHMGRDFPLAEGKSLFRVFQKNFVAYHAWGVFEVEAMEEKP